MMVSLIGTPNVSAGDVAGCAAAYISYSFSRTGQSGEGLKAVGKVSPSMADIEDNGSKAPLLALIVIRRESAPTDGKPMAMEPKSLGDFSAVKLDFSKSLKQDGFEIEVQAAQVILPNDERSLACAFATNRTTNLTGAIICRSTNKTGATDLQAKVQGIVDNDLPAVRF